MSVEVILLEKIRNLGVLGDFVKVAPGYARNYLIPRQKAVPASKHNVESFAARKAELELKERERIALAVARASKLNTIQLSLDMRASEDGKLFGSVGVYEIVNAVKKAGEVIDRSEVILPNGPIKYIGDYSIELNLQHGDATATIKLVVNPEA